MGMGLKGFNIFDDHIPNGSCETASDVIGR
jgi:hypothetical protein